MPLEMMPYKGTSSSAAAEPIVVNRGAYRLEQSRYYALANFSDKPPVTLRDIDETAVTQVQAGEDIYKEKVRQFVVKVTKTNNYIEITNN